MSIPQVLSDVEQKFAKGVKVHNLTMDQTLVLIRQAIKEGTQLHHTVINAGKFVAMMKDPALYKSVVEADLINADGQAIVWASKFLGHPLKERVAGVDLMEKLVEEAHINKYKIFFFGATEEVVSKIVQVYSEMYSPDIIAGFRSGYFKKEEEHSIAQQINQSGANILFVAISSPTKENFLFNYKEQLKNVNFIMGVGGSFDVVAGKVRRAPIWMQDMGLEWFYRVIQEPKRMWKRYLIGNTKFIYLVLKTKLKH